ncbi:MAG: DUF4268 domain-containing protein [Lachnospiraceae bacterium]|nr:DUF4268 domain-containing protein [Lachnospiraceae bacterium]
MKGSETKLLEYMEGAKKRFVIPVYQRNYDWKMENCKQLYDDLVKVVRNHRKSHFFGSIVSSYQPNGRYTEYLVIDGQQRLTTVSLLLLAMYTLIKEGKVTPQTETMAQEIFEDYLVDKHQPKETRVKLKPVKNDRSAFEKLFDIDDENDKQSNLTYNYEYFYNRIQKEEISIEDLYDALFALEIINIELTSDDDPQLIFESLNSTGMALSEGDKIRNYILMGLPASLQNDYYEKYWNKIELCTNYDVSMFVRDYLSVKQQAIPSISRVYVTFKAYVEENKIETEVLLKDLLDYTKWYEILLKGKTEDKKLNACIYRLNRLETTVTRPFFLEVLRMMTKGSPVLSLQDAREVFLLTENYLFRRSICDLPTNALNKIFLMLHREIIRFDGTEADYLEKFKYALLSKVERGRFPNNDEFSEFLGTRQIYLLNIKNKAYILERFENYGIDEDKDIYRHLDEGTYSIEHIMPQHLTPQWVSALGDDYEDIHETWLHRLANLTLTAYNSKYSNNSFADKRDMEKGFRQSGLRMNTWIAQQEKWTLTELEERREMLVSRALTIWPMPETSYRPAEKQLDSYTLEDDVDLSGREIVRFGYKNTEQPVDSWITMMAQILKILHAEDKSVLARLAHTDNPDDELNDYISDNPADLRGALEIDQNIYLERNTSTSTKLAVLKKFFKVYGENPEELVFYLKDQNADQKADEVGTLKETRRKYWTYALEYIKSAHGREGAFKNVNPTKEYWISGWFGISGFSISCYAKQSAASVELDLAKSDRDKNKSAYDYLFVRKAEIEKTLGIPLDWWRFEGKASYVHYQLDLGLSDEANWTQMAKFHAEWSKKFYDVFVPLLQQWNAMR